MGSPIQKIGVIPFFKAALTFLFKSSFDSLKIVLRSEWPTMAYLMPKSLACSKEISPVKAPLAS